MNRQEIESKIKGILVDTLYVEEPELTNDAKLCEDLNADSIDCVEIIMALESKFCVSIPDDRAEKCTTVKDVCDLMEELTLHHQRTE